MGANIYKKWCNNFYNAVAVECLLYLARPHMDILTYKKLFVIIFVVNLQILTSLKKHPSHNFFTRIKIINMRFSERAPRFGSHRWSILDDPIQNISEITMHLILFLYIRTVRILQKK